VPGAYMGLTWGLQSAPPWSMSLDSVKLPHVSLREGSGGGRG